MSDPAGHDSADDLEPALAELAEQITRRLQSGEPVSATDLIGENSACAGPIRQLLPTLRTMVALGGSLAREMGPQGRLRRKKDNS